MKKISINKEAKQKIGSTLLIFLLIMTTLTGMFVMGPLSPITVKAAPGDIADAVIDDWAFSSAGEGELTNFQSFLRINDTDFYVVFHANSDNDGAHLTTLEIWNSNGTIHEVVIDEWIFSTNDIRHCAISHINNTNKYVIYYADKDVTDSKIATFNISESGLIDKSFIDSQSDANLDSYSLHGRPLFLTDNVFLVVDYQDNVDDGFLQSWWIDSDGMINNTQLDFEEYDSSYAGYPSLCKVDSDTILLSYVDGSLTGDYKFLTYNVSSSGLITDTPADSWAYETEPNQFSHTSKIGVNTFLVVYTDADDDLQAKTFNVSDAGVITKSWIDTLEIVAGDSLSMSSIPFVVDDPLVFGAGVYGVAVRGIAAGPENSGYIYTFNVSSVGVLGDSIVDSIEFAPAVSEVHKYPQALYMGGNSSYYAVVSCNSSLVSSVYVVEIETSLLGGGEVPTNSVPVPSNGAINQELNPDTTITVNHTNGSLMTIVMSTNASGVWANIATWENSANNTHTFAANTVFDEYSTKYWWKVSTNDSYGNWDNNTYYFTTKSGPNANPPVNSNPIPANAATDQELTPFINITITEPDGNTMNLTFRTNASGTWQDADTNLSVGNGTYYCLNNTWVDSYDTTYWWSANTSDGHGNWDNDTYYFTTKSDPADDGWGPWSETWTISIGHNSTSTGYLYGNWSHSEHVAEGTLDEGWTFSNPDEWDITDHSSWWAGNHTMEVDMNLTNHAFAVFNNSGMNRSQSFGWLHMNQSEYAPIWPYIIFAYNNSQDFYVAAFNPISGMGPEGVWLMHWNGTNMTNLNGTPIIDPNVEGENVFSQDADYPLGDYSLPEGAFFKLIYNSKSGYIDFKCWSDWGADPMTEPSGWLASEVNETLKHPDYPMGYGVGVWNPYEVDAQFQFDWINLWQVNRTTNSSATITINDHAPSYRPHMNFPVLNMTTISELYWQYYDNESENITSDIIQDIMLEYTNMFNMEAITAIGDQFDNIYYYSTTITDLISFIEMEEEGEIPEWLYDEYLYLIVQMCPEENIGFEMMCVGIDVDNDGNWDNNDRMFFMNYNPVTDVVTLDQYNGEVLIPEANFLGNVFISDTSGVGNIHRYNSYLNYQIMIPLSELVKHEGHPINTSDIFGLSISNTMAWGADVFNPFYTWQDYNESSEDYCMTPVYGTAFYYFYGAEGPDPNLTAWGEGCITGEFVPSGGLSYTVSIDKSSNITVIPEGSTEYYVNYSIWINNTGTGTLTNVILNDTVFNCEQHDFEEWEILDTNISWENMTSYDTYRHINVSLSLAPGESVHLWYVIQIIPCEGVTIGNLRNNASVNATELSESIETHNTMYWGYDPSDTGGTRPPVGGGGGATLPPQTDEEPEEETISVLAIIVPFILLIIFIILAIALPIPAPAKILFIIVGIALAVIAYLMLV